MELESYTEEKLGFYDWIVWRFVSPFVWRCRAKKILRLYNENVSANHLEVATGTGFFLKRCRFPTDKPRLVLTDVSQPALDMAEKRLKKYQPEVAVANVMEPLKLEGPPFDSVAFNFLLHCLPGNIESKAIVFDHVKDVLVPGGVVFGATVLTGGVELSKPAEKAIERLNEQGVMQNLDDNLDDLKEALEKRFTTSSVEVSGCVALFRAVR